MTPQERQLVDELFDRLAKLETAPRDTEAERAVMDGLRRAPNAVYALVQTALVQDEALRRADARIRELSGEGDAPEGAGFLDSMRQAFLGRTRGSVPSVPLARANGPDTRWNTGGATPQANAPAQPQSAFGGGSFLGTAAASAAGVVAGSLLLNSISSMFGHHGGGQALASTPSNSPWDNSAASSDLARDAGANDIGGRSSFFGHDNDDASRDDLAGDMSDFDGGDFGSDT